MSDQYVPELCSTGAPGYCTWCWFGLLCQLPASYFLGKRLGEKRVFLKYGIAAICMVLFSCYAYYQMYLLIEGILNLDFNDFNDQACNVFLHKIYQYNNCSIAIIWIFTLSTTIC